MDDWIFLSQHPQQNLFRRAQAYTKGFHSRQGKLKQTSTLAAFDS